MKQKMISSLSILLALFGLSVGAAVNPSNKAAGCVINGVQEDDFLMEYVNSPIRDDFSGVVANFSTQGVSGVKLSGSKYFSASLVSNVLQIVTTNEFKNIEPAIGYAPIPAIKFQLNLQCASGNANLRFTQPLRDINNHDPVFSKSSLEYVYVQDYLPIYHQLTDDQNLSVSDIDMTNYRVALAFVGNNNFTANGSSTDPATRQTRIRITSLRNIKAPASIKLNLTASDVRRPLRTAYADINVHVLLKSNGSVPVPAFSNDSYVVSHKNGELIFNQEIRLAKGNGYLANIKQIGYEDYFKVSFANRAEGVLKVDLLKPISHLSETKNSNVQFEVQLLNEGSSQPAVTKVTVNFPQD
ncbi:uncharacterized protein LOC108743477 [Agrilus planipennis]|uniref:Uncharacterized protein LOC108743477 n=1 Tax=Agrilus planipennis TaxID=224129 RepID=A0A1W4XEW2_AGRPL|nr:uncharacterized protein LOC108743477 [Agrilus planipennis]